MSNLPSEPEFQQAYNGECPDPKTQLCRAEQSSSSASRRGRGTRTSSQFRVAASENAELTARRLLELVSTLENSTLFQKNPEYKTALSVVSIPERIIQFRVVWENDKGE